jgi:S1-C subfamily serine protease
MQKRVAVYLSALLSCILIGSCATPPVSPSATPPVSPPDLKKKTPAQQRIFEILWHWDLLRDSAWDPYPSAGSVRTKEDQLIGSGVLISPLHVLTAAHVADFPGEMYFTEYDGDCIRVKHVENHPDYKFAEIDHDLAILTLESPSEEKYATHLFGDSKEDKPRPFMPVRVIGYSFDMRKVSERGVFKYFGKTEERPSVIIMLPIAASVWNGDSGGPMFTEDGKLIGIITHYRSAPDGKVLLNGAASVEYHREWIQEVISEI